PEAYGEQIRRVNESADAEPEEHRARNEPFRARGARLLSPFPEAQERGGSVGGDDEPSAGRPPVDPGGPATDQVIPAMTVLRRGPGRGTPRRRRAPRRSPRIESR